MRPIVVTWDGGARFTADIRGHKLVVDQPAKGGGEDSAPMPAELLPASLGTCIALYVQRFLATRSLDASGLEVAVSAVGAPNPNRIARFDVDVKIPGGVPEKYRDAVKRAAEGCTVHHTLMNAPEIAVSIQEGAGVGSTSS
jgi:putative redox protein